VVTGSGLLEGAVEALGPGSMLVTGRRGAHALEGVLPAHTEVIVLGDGTSDRIPVARLMEVLAARYRRVLTEGGPHLFGELLAAGVVDELFLTLAPVAAGGPPGAAGLAGPTALWDAGAGRRSGPPPGAELIGVRRHEAYLFLRYDLRRASPPGPSER
jgi:riboflavin biosynthesis pyrimidine reductase